MAANGIDRPYRLSWIDRFNNWVGKLPVPPWVIYGGLAIGLILVQVLFLLLDGGHHTQVLLPLIIFNGLSMPFLLGLIHLLDDQAVAALDSMRPVLEMTEAEFDEFQYKLSNMPSRPTLLAGLATLVSYVLLELLWIAPARFAALEQLPTFAIIFQIIDKVPAFLFGGFFYHTIRQLRLVNTVNSNYTRISLYNLGPLQAFSKLTASTAVGLVFGILGWMVLNPDLLADPVSLAFAASYTVLATIIFVWPLWGVHRLMQTEKEKALHELDLRFEAAFERLNQLVHDDDYASTETLNSTIASLDIQYRKTGAIPTWPWRPETARFALTAIALPLILTILQFFVLQAIGR